MPELRRDPIAREWIVLAPERVRRPAFDLDADADANPPRESPFVHGAEDQTPPELWADRRGAPNTPGWNVRVVPNRVPALAVEGRMEPAAHGLYDTMRGIGAHEIIIETPDPEARLSELEPARIAGVLQAAQQRMRDLSGDIRLSHALLFKDEGPHTGAALRHSITQLLATPFIPPRVQLELDGAAAYHDHRGRCAFCDIIAQELRERVRVVRDWGDAIALCPYASRSPFEVWVLPTAHRSRFEHARAGVIAAVARALRDALDRLSRALGGHSYRLVLHSAPLRSDVLPHYHWHFEIHPALSPRSALELHAGCPVNPILPEKAAPFLRQLH